MPPGRRDRGAERVGTNAFITKIGDGAYDLAVGPSGIYWTRDTFETQAIGHATLSGRDVDKEFIPLNAPDDYIGAIALGPGP